MINILSLPDVALHLILLQYLDHKDLVSFDSAICNKQIRDIFIDSVYYNWSIPILNTSLLFLKFAERRQINIKHLIINKTTSSNNKRKKIHKLKYNNLRIKSLKIDMSVVSSYINKSNSNGDNVLINMIENIKNLEVISISYNNASITTDKTLETLVRCQSKSLKSVTLIGCRGYSSNGIGLLATLPLLEEFRLTDTCINTHTLETICKNTQLKSLDLSGAFMNALMIEQILPSFSSHIVSLSLAGCYMIYGDDAVEIVRQVLNTCVHLKKLDVTGLLSSHSEWQSLLISSGNDENEYENENQNQNSIINNVESNRSYISDNNNNYDKDQFQTNKAVMKALSRLQHISLSYQQSAHTTHRFSSEHRESILFLLLRKLTHLQSLEVYLREDGSLGDGVITTAASTCNHLKKLVVAYNYLSNIGFNQPQVEGEELEYGGPDMVVHTQTLVELKQVVNNNSNNNNSNHDSYSDGKLTKKSTLESRFVTAYDSGDPLEVVVYGLLEKDALLRLKDMQMNQKMENTRKVRVIQHPPELPNEFIHDLQTQTVSLHNIFV